MLNVFEKIEKEKIIKSVSHLRKSSNKIIIKDHKKYILFL